MAGVVGVLSSTSLLVVFQFSDPNAIMRHVCDFYSQLLAVRPTSGISISPSLWPLEACVSVAENVDLMIPLSTEEVDAAVATSNSNSASGPDGFSITFLRSFALR